MKGSVKISFSFEGLFYRYYLEFSRESFGALPYIIGALVSPAIEIVIGVPVSLGIAIFGLELPSPKISTPLSFVIELCCLWALLVYRVWSVGLIEMSL